jgi:ribonuclease P protein component
VCAATGTATGPVRATFRKEERLTGRTAIRRLMEEGQRLSVPPIRLVWRLAAPGAPYPARAAFAVSSRAFPSAVDRNRIKRQLREIYRKNKWRLYALLSGSAHSADIMILFTSRTLPAFATLEKKFSQALDELEEHLADRSQ